MSTSIYDAKGRIVRLDGSHTQGARDPLGTLRFGMRRVSMRDVVTNGDPASHLSAAITDAGDGLGFAFPLTGIWTSTEITDDAPYVTAPLLDVFRNPVGGTDLILSTAIVVVARATLPTVTDNVKFGAVIHNERDWRTATVDGRGVGVQFNVTNPSSQGISIANGTTSNGTSATAAGVVGAVGPVTRLGRTATTTEQWMGSISQGFDSNFDIVASTPATRNASNGTGADTGLYYVTLFAARTDVANVANFTVKFDAYYVPILVTGRPA